MSRRSISIDGTDIREVAVRDLRALIGNVNQEPILFNDTIYNNIAFAPLSVTQEEVEHAATIANAHGFISRLPEGYQTNIGDRGNKLSGENASVSALLVLFLKTLRFLF